MFANLKTYYAALYDILWCSDPKGFPPVKRIAVYAVQIFYLIFRDIKDGLLPLRAMSLVYTTLLSLVPLLAVSFSVLKGFGVHNQLEPALLNIFSPLGEKGVEITQNIIGFVERVNVGVLGALGVTILIYTVVTMIQKIEAAFNFIWRVENQRSLVQRVSNYLSVLLIGPLLVFTAVGLTATVSASSVVQTLMTYPVIGELINVGGRLLPYVVIIAAFTFVYIFVPNTRVNVIPAIVGAAVAGTLWETVGWLFASFIIGTTKYTAIYSAFATLIVFMIWLYASWMICLVGANISFYVQHPDKIRLQRQTLHLSNRQREKTALLCMALVGKHFYQGLQPWTLESLAGYLSVPQNVLQKVLNILFEAKLLIETAEQPPYLMPARPAEKILLSDIISVVRREGEQQAGEVKIPTDKTIDDIYQHMELSIDQSLGDKTLRDIANVELNVVDGIPEKVVS